MYTNRESLNGIFQYSLKSAISPSTADEVITQFMNYDGTLPNLRVGNYFSIYNGDPNAYYDTYWVVADINWNVRIGDSNYDKNWYSVTLMPLQLLNGANRLMNPESTSGYGISMNSTKTTGVSQNPLNPLYETTQGQEMSGYQGYYGSDMNQIYLPKLSNILKNTLGSHLNTDVRQIMGVSVDLEQQAPTGMTGKVIELSWRDTNGIILPNEYEISGSSPWATSPFDSSTVCKKLSLFNFVNPIQFSRNSFYTRTVASKYHFTVYQYRGGIYANEAQTCNAIRPLIFLI